MHHTARIAVLFVLLLALPVVTACGGDDGGDDSGKLKVVATTVQVGAVAREVGGDSIALTVLAGPGVDPHDFEPTAKQLKSIDEARVILRNGIGLDEWLDHAIKSAGGEQRATTVTSGIAIRSGSGAGSEDPHVWHDPANVKTMTANIAKALAAADPANASTYGQRFEAYAMKLDAIDAEIRTLIDSIPAPNRKVVTDHDAFGYFFARYGIELVGVVIPGSTTQSEPSAQEVAALIQTIRRESVKAIFSEETADPKVARQVAADTGVKIIDNLLGDSLGEPGSGQETLDGMLLFNARTIAGALK